MHVLICGGGPAGAVAGIVLARAGVRVRILDRARFPRDKLCGDTLNPGALAVLARLGLGHVCEGGRRVDGMIVTGDAGVRVVGRYGGSVTGRSLPRRDLDAALLDAAARAGAEVEEGVLVREPRISNGVVSGLVVAGRDGRSIALPAPLSIAADGAHSRLARALGVARLAPRPRRWAVGAYFEGVAELGAFGEMHVRRGLYVGVAPLPGALANACVVTPDRLALADPARLLEGTLRADAMLSSRFAAARRVTRVTCMGPLAVESTAAGVPGLLLAGDAAGFIDPMTGDGLRFALRGAELAAIETLHTLQHGGTQAHVRLLSARRHEFSGKWRFNRALRALVGSPLAVRAAALGARWAPSWIEQTICYAGDLRAA